MSANRNPIAGQGVAMQLLNAIGAIIELPPNIMELTIELKRDSIILLDVKCAAAERAPDQIEDLKARLKAVHEDPIAAALVQELLDVKAQGQRRRAAAAAAAQTPVPPETGLDSDQQLEDAGWNLFVGTQRPEGLSDNRQVAIMDHQQVVSMCRHTASVNWDDKLLKAWRLAGQL